MYVVKNLRKKQKEVIVNNWGWFFSLQRSHLTTAESHSQWSYIDLCILDLYVYTENNNLHLHSLNWVSQTNYTVSKKLESFRNDIFSHWMYLELLKVHNNWMAVPCSSPDLSIFFKCIVEENLVLIYILIYFTKCVDLLTSFSFHWKMSPTGLLGCLALLMIYWQ